MITQTAVHNEAEMTSPSRIGFCYVWNTKISMRAVSDDDAVILIISPKFATVHDHVSFQWSLKIHGTTGRVDVRAVVRVMQKDAKNDDKPEIVEE
ncbi:hypothetical protein OSTOST_04844, partial [Ostertagia ostertagi]